MQRQGDEDRVRRAYYDRFSRYYDRFVAIHSRDTEGLARKFLADRLPVQRGGMVLDLCTGTAALVPPLRAKVGPEGRVVGLDFSHGMLKVGREKVRGFANVHLVEADAGSLPFPAGCFDVVTCSHAFYELKGQTRQRVLREVVRVLKPTGAFLMMEHDVPPNPFTRALFYLRLTFVGGGRATTFLRHEREVLEQHFGSVDKVVAPAGRSKVVVCRR